MGSVFFFRQGHISLDNYKGKEFLSRVVVQLNLIKYITMQQIKARHIPPQLEEIANRYGLDLDDAWNKDLLPHQGRHPNAYHENTFLIV